jgi:PAS domain S-box-containing protein
VPPAGAGSAPGAGRRAARASALAAGLAGGGLAAAAFVSPYLDTYTVLPSVAAVLLAAWYGGLGPGLLATCVSVVGIDLLFVEPRLAFGAPTPSDALRLTFFVLLSAGASVAGRRLRRTTRALAERTEVVARQLAELESTYAHAGVGLCVLDAELRWVRINETLAEMNGFPPEAHLGRRVRELLPDIADQAEPMLRRILETGEAVHDVELVGETPSRPGVTRVWREQFLPLRAADGRVVGINVVAEEVTARRAVERERERERAALREAVVELAHTNYAIAHDLRSPLRAINGYAYLVERELRATGAALDGEAGEAIANIRATSRRMGELLDGLLALARIGRQPLAPAAVDLGALARQTLGECLAGDTPERRVELRTHGDLDAWGDPRLLQSVMQNLVANACKFTGARDPARIEIGRAAPGTAGPAAPHASDASDGAAPGADPTYFVRDNGVGFDPEQAGQLFRPFHRLHRADEFPGHGIGLATVARAVGRHGGRVWAEGATGRGATFWFTLPGPAASARHASVREERGEGP